MIWGAVLGIVCGVVSLLLGLLRIRPRAHSTGNQKSIAFFHPFCNDGGGGERVLWCGINAIQRKYGKRVQCHVYTGDALSKETILANMKKHFDIPIDADNLEFIRIRSRKLLEPSTYPRFTMIGQLIGGLIVALEALCKLRPHVMIDTTGHAASMAIFKLFGGTKVACYVHYPTITVEMIGKVESQASAHNNDSTISKSAWKTWLKLRYYGLYAAVYKQLGRFSDATMVNSSWTAAHISSLWGGVVVAPSQRTFVNNTPNTRTIQIVYPPCNTENLQKFPFEGRHQTIISVGQFRPEKNHALQLEAFALLLEQHPSLRRRTRLVLIGSARHAADSVRVTDLKALANNLQIQDDVEFCVNAPYNTLLEHLSTAVAGLHTMWNEHFGIGVVEFMAAGVIAIAHDSAGPRMDILTPLNKGRQTGFLATSAEQYAAAMWKVLNFTPEEQLALQTNGREKSRTFSDQVFGDAFVSNLDRFKL